MFTDRNPLKAVNAAEKNMLSSLRLNKTIRETKLSQPH
jgi:hypothetical protein